MDSAGKCLTHPPIHFPEDLIPTTKHNVVPITTPSISTTTVPSIETTSTEVTRRGMAMENSLNAIQKMINQMVTESRANRIEDKAEYRTALDSVHQRVSEMCQANTDQVSQCVQRWQVMDMRVTKLEDEGSSQNKQQEAINIQVSERLKNLEMELGTIREGILKLPVQSQLSHDVETSQVFAPAPLSSTSIPLNASHVGQTTSLKNQTSVFPNMYDASRSSMFTTQERLQDAVSEFSGVIKNVHPEKFISQLDTYFDNIYLSLTQQLMSAQRRLIGDARVWYESLIPAPKTYEEFCNIFRQHFWSVAIQRKVRNEVFRPWRHNRYDGLATHAMQWIASAKYLNPPIDQGDLVCTIIQHYPTPLGMAIYCDRNACTHYKFVSNTAYNVIIFFNW